MVDLTVLTSLGPGHLWRLPLITTAIDAYEPPASLEIVIVDNTQDGMPESALNGYSPTILRFDEVRSKSASPMMHTKRKWQPAISQLDSEYVLMIDSDVIPSATFEQMRLVMEDNPRIGSLSLIVRCRDSGRCLNAITEQGRVKNATELVKVLRTGSAVILFRGKAIRRIDLVDGKQFGGCWEETLFGQIKMGDWECWAAGQFGVCKHFVSPGKFIT